MKRYKHFTFTPLAMSHLKDIKLYYRLTKVKGLSSRFSKAVRAAIRHTLDNPGVHTIRYNDVMDSVREMFSIDYPYIIITDSLY